MNVMAAVTPTQSTALDIATMTSPFIFSSGPLPEVSTTSSPPPEIQSFSSPLIFSSLPVTPSTEAESLTRPFPSSASSSSTVRKSYGSRAVGQKCPAAKRLLELMERKKTNLCVSVDVTTSKEMLEVVRRVGASCCMIKTHVDIIEDFSEGLITELTQLSEELDFIIFEDRKFADIGNTVSLQYSSGVHHIASWSHITNAHPIPGDGIITGLSSIGKPLSRGLLLLAEMSSKGNLAKGQYTKETVEMARRHWADGFVMGFIAMHRVQDTYPSSSSSLGEEDFLILTPGVGLDSKGDKMGQQYRTPREVVYGSGCDVIIVGRGIYGKSGEEEVRSEAERYRAEGWKAYEERIKA